MIVCLFTAIAGTIIETIFDDGDSNAANKDTKQFDAENFMRQFTAKTMFDIHRGSDATDPEEYRIIKEIAKNTDSSISAYNEANRVGRIIHDPYGDVSTAEKHGIVSKYSIGVNPDDEVSGKTATIYKSIDPSDDDDIEMEDAFSFETEIENLFGPEQMAISEEDIAPESDIQDWDITEPTDEISQDREIIVGDDTVDPEDEISQIEETTPFEPVFYPDETDLDMDFTDNTEEIFYPTEQYDITEDNYTEWPEQELDDMADELEGNIFESAAWTFDQDMSQETLTSDNTYQDIGQAMNVIDFEDFLDDTAAITLDLISDHMGIPWFQWLDQAPGGETLDTSPF